MAETEQSAAATEISQLAEPELSPATVDPASSQELDAAQEGEAAPADPAAPSEPDEASASAAPPTPDHKRKLDSLEQPLDGEAAPEKEADVTAPPPADDVPAVPKPEEIGLDGETKVPAAAAADPGEALPAKRQRLDEETDGSAVAVEQELQKLEAPPAENGQHSHVENSDHAFAANLHTPNVVISEEGNISSAGQQPVQTQEASRKLEVPNNKVGVLIGRSGETIKLLQHNSGAKIQITRDAEADPNSSSRPVELIGTLESINKAEQLIKDVIKEAEAGGSPALVAKGFGNAQSGSDQHEMRIPYEKVGWIIGKGGEKIKSLQTQSGARIQLNLQNLPEGEGDTSSERVVLITGNKRQIETAKSLIKQVLNQAPVRSSAYPGGYGHSRPRGPSSMNTWGPRTTSPAQPAGGYGYQQRGMYPPQSTQYPSQTYGSYTQPPPRNNINTSWDQRASAPTQTGGYDYYGQGGQSVGAQPSNPAAAQSSAPVNYNYGQSQAASYGQPTPYTQSAPSQQNYGQGFTEQKYDNQAPPQQYYGQQPISSQSGAYPQHGGAPQADYAQQQPKTMYQGATPSYGAGGSTQQSYPYGQNVPTQPVPAYGQSYGSASGVADGYTQQPSSAATYPQNSGQVAPGYGQVGQPAPAYTQQGPQTGGYGQYPSTQPSYGEQPAPNNVNYGYQGGSADPGYGVNNSVPASGYGPTPAVNQAGYGQAGYVQPPQSGYVQPPQSYPPGYEQQVPAQPGYGSQPQPAYGGQYDSAQVYGQH